MSPVLSLSKGTRERSWHALDLAVQVGLIFAGTLVIAAERGLCGGFNRAVLEAAEGFIAEQRAQGQTLHLLALGERARQHFQRQGEPILRAERLPTTALWPFAQA